MNSQELIDSIKSRSLVPLSQSTFGDSDLLSFATDLMRTRIIPLIIRFQEEYFTRDEITSIIPKRALGGKLKSVSMVGNGREIPLKQVDASDFSRGLSGFFIKGNQVYLANCPTWYKPKLTYYVRPGKLVLPQTTCEIKSCELDKVQVDLIPSSIQVGTRVDIIAPEPTFEYLGSHKIADIKGTTISFDDIPDSFEGGFVALAGESPVPQIPLEFHPLLAQAVACQLLESLGFEDKAAAAKQTLERMESDIIPLISPRVDDSRKRVINRNQLVRFS